MHVSGTRMADSINKVMVLMEPHTVVLAKAKTPVR